MNDEIASEEEIVLDSLESNSDIIEEISTMKSDLINLNLGEDISMAECKHITRSNMTRVIVIAGEVESGKTTLLASIYSQFLKGPYSDYIFALASLDSPYRRLDSVLDAVIWKFALFSAKSIIIRYLQRALGPPGESNIKKFDELSQEPTPAGE